MDIVIAWEIPGCLWWFSGKVLLGYEEFSKIFTFDDMPVKFSNRGDPCQEGGKHWSCLPREVGGVCQACQWCLNRHLNNAFKNALYHLVSHELVTAVAGPFNWNSLFSSIQNNIKIFKWKLCTGLKCLHAHAVTYKHSNTDHPLKSACVTFHAIYFAPPIHHMQYAELKDLC